MSPEIESPRVYVFFDYVCPYAYIGKERADRLQREYDIEIEFLPWEIYPNAVPAGEEHEIEAPDGYLSWVEEMAAEVDLELDGPEIGINSNLALRGALYAREQGPETFEAYNDAVFEAVWSHGKNIGDRQVLAGIVEDVGLDPEAFFDAIEQHSYQYRLDLIDEAAEEKLAVKRVPTFVFGDQRIVGNDRFEPSLKRPLEAFLERRKSIGPDWTTTIEHDTDLAPILDAV